MPSLREVGYTPDEPKNEVDYINSDPNKSLGFEIEPTFANWSFVPEFYPEDFTQMKKRELNRYGGGCRGESVSIESAKNREFHVGGVLLEGEINIFHALQDYDDVVDILSPLTPSGGMECYIKQSELGNQSGWDPHNRQWMFEYSIDLVSTGTDERSRDENDIITAIGVGSQTQTDPQSYDLFGRETDEVEYEMTRNNP
jgi:hypothetical protein